MKAVGTKGKGKPGSPGKALSDIPALKPYRGKPAVRNFRGGDGNVGIIRSPVRAIALPDNRLEAENGKFLRELRRHSSKIRTGCTNERPPGLYGAQPEMVVPTVLDNSSLRAALPNKDRARSINHSIFVGFFHHTSSSVVELTGDQKSWLNNHCAYCVDIAPFPAHPALCTNIHRC